MAACLSRWSGGEEDGHKVLGNPLEEIFDTHERRWYSLKSLGGYLPQMTGSHLQG